MRLIGSLVVFCLLVAGATRHQHANHDRERSNDEIATVKALAKVAARRHDGTRPVGVGLDPMVRVGPPELDRPRPPCIEITWIAAPLVCITTVHAVRVRGPPVMG